MFAIPEYFLPSPEVLKSLCGQMEFIYGLDTNALGKVVDP